MIFSIRYLSAIFIALVLALLDISIATAHGSHERRLRQLEHQINQMPAGEAVELLLQRADLHRRQNAWEAALHDYQSVASLEPDNIHMTLGRAQLHLDQQQFFIAIEWSSRALHLEPATTRAGLLHARALLGIGDFDSAAIVYGDAMGKLSQPRPEHYIELAQIVSADKGHPDSESRAIAVLDNGIHKLGNLVSLHEFAFQLELQEGDREAALRRIDKVLALNDSLLNWRMQRGELLLDLGHMADAREEALCLIYRIQQLPQQRRRSQVFADLMTRSQRIVERVNVVRMDSVLHASNDSTALC